MELHLRRFLHGLALALFEIEEVDRLEVEALRDQHAGEALARGVIFGGGVVEEAARGGDLVFDVGEFALQLLEIGVGLEVGIGFGDRDQPPERPAERGFRRRLRRRTLRGHGEIARPGHFFQSVLLVRRIALHGFDEIGDEIVTLLELHVDVGKCLAIALAHRHEAVIGRHQPHADKRGEPEKNKKHGALPGATSARMESSGRQEIARH